MTQISEEEIAEAERDLVFWKARNYGFEALEDLGEGAS